MSAEYFDNLQQAFTNAAMKDPDYTDPIRAGSAEESAYRDRISQVTPGMDQKADSEQTLDSIPLRTVNATSGSYITLACYRLSGSVCGLCQEVCVN